MNDFLKFNKVAQTYLRELDQYTYEQFTQKPTPDAWSLGEMYNHVIDTGYRQLAAAKECLYHPADPYKKKTAAGMIVFAFNRIPPVKAKAPGDLLELVKQPESIDEVRERLEVFIERMKEEEPAVKRIPADKKVEHPYFGFLNAEEWYKHIESHFRHHLRQKKRIEAVVL